VVSTDLIDAERDGLLFGRVLALYNEHRNAVDEKNYVFPRTVTAIVDVELLGNFVHVAALLAGARQIAIVDEGQVQLTLFLRTVEFALVPEVRQEISIAVYVSLEAFEFANKRTFGLFVFRIEGANLLVEQIAKEGCRRARAILWRCRIRIKAPPRVNQLSYPFEVREAALAHGKANAVVEAYDRSKLFEARRKLMQAWSDFVTGAK
jgi:hypothetical protein